MRRAARARDARTGSSTDAFADVGTEGDAAGILPLEGCHRARRSALAPQALLWSDRRNSRTMRATEDLGVESDEGQSLALGNPNVDRGAGSQVCPRRRTRRGLCAARTKRHRAGGTDEQIGSTLGICRRVTRTRERGDDLDFEDGRYDDRVDPLE